MISESKSSKYAHCVLTHAYNKRGLILKKTDHKYTNTKTYSCLHTYLFVHIPENITPNPSSLPVDIVEVEPRMSLGIPTFRMTTGRTFKKIKVSVQNIIGSITVQC